MTAATRPDISILVCTRNRATALAPCLDSILLALRAADWPAAELVVVDNGSSDDTVAVIRRWAATAADHLQVQLLQEPRPGLAVARNAALRAARGRLLVCTDDDCCLATTYLRELLAHDAADGARLVLRGGRVLLGDPADLPCTIKDVPVPERYGLDEARPLHLGGVILGCNMAMRRAVVDRVGLFDERFGAGAPLRSGEDTEYLARAYLAGIGIAYVPDMVVHHHHGRRDAGSLRRLLEGYSEGNGAFFAKIAVRDWRLARQFWWDGRDAALELLGLRSSFAEFGFGAPQRFVGYLRGGARYLGLLLRGVPAVGSPHAR